MLNISLLFSLSLNQPRNDPYLVGSSEQKRVSKEEFFDKMTVRDLLQALGKPVHGRSVVILNAKDTVQTALKV